MGDLSIHNWNRRCNAPDEISLGGRGDPDVSSRATKPSIVSWGLSWMMLLLLLVVMVFTIVVAVVVDQSA